MKRSRTLRLAPVVLLFLAALGCTKDHELDLENDRDPHYGGSRPPIPTNLSCVLSSRAVSIAWELPDSSLATRVRSYKIYSRTDAADDPELADSSQTSPMRIDGLANGQVIAFSVSAVLDNGLEGKRSKEMTVEPGIFSVMLDGGRSVTASRQVSVGLQAPDGTTTVSLSSALDLAGAIPQGYQRSLTWILEEGDGDKTVYARFGDSGGNVSEVVADQIRLDTVAQIRSFGFDGGENRVPGDIIVFTLDAGEPAGTAEVEITRGGTRRTMRDDGIAPDAAPGDGIYTLRYEAEVSLQFVGAEVIGLFQDEAGNDAPERPAARRLTVHALPEALTLEEPTSSGTQEITLRWSRVPQGAPFAAYRLYRSEQAGVALDPARRLVRESTSRDQTTHTDTGLQQGKVYFYEVELVDPQGFSTPSNEVDGLPLHNDPPAAVILEAPFAVTSSSVSLSWSRSSEPDFAFYRVVRGERPDVSGDPARRILTTISSIASTTHDDTLELEEGKTYSYVVEVVDNLGAGSTSNTVTATPDDLFPAAVTLSAPDPVGQSTIGLSWTASGDRDFASYKLYRSESAGVGETDLLIATISEAERTRWLDEGLQAAKHYYYRIYVRDKGGHATPSNEIDVETASPSLSR